MGRNTGQTSPTVAKAAGKVLSSSKSSKAAKPVAASAFVAAAEARQALIDRRRSTKGRRRFAITPLRGTLEGLEHA